MKMDRYVGTLQMLADYYANAYEILPSSTLFTKCELPIMHVNDDTNEM